jgi:FHA domain
MKLTSRRDRGAGQKVDGRTARFRQLAWASVPLWSFGFLAYAPFLYLAVIRRRIRDWAVFVAYLAAWTLVMTAVSGGGGGAAGAFSWIANLLVPLVGLAVVHAFIAFRPGSAPASWPDAHALTNLPDRGAGQKLVDRTGRFRQLAWASVPLWSFGFFAFAPFLYLAVIRRRIRDWAVFVAYLAVCTLVMTAIYAGGSAGVFSWVAVLLILLVGLAAVHAFIVLRPGGSLLPPWRDVDAAGCVSADPVINAGLAVEVVDGPCAGTALAWNHAEIVLGRGAEGSELFACDPEISERHAIVRCGPDGFCVVESIGSAGGILVNGVSIDGPTQMRPGDELRVGRTRLRVTSVTPDPVSMVVPSAEPAVNAPTGAPHEPEPSRGMPGVLRADPVQLWNSIRGLWLYGKAEKGWLILTVTGEVRFYERLPADMAAAPDLSAPSTTEFAQGIGDAGIRAHFGEQRRNVIFTGAKPRALSAEKLEEAGTTEESLANLGDSSGDRSLSVGGDAAALAIDILQGVSAIRDRKRRLAAMRAWYPVLLGEQPWPLIEAGPSMDVNWDKRAQHLHQRDQRALDEAADQLAVTEPFSS